MLAALIAAVLVAPTGCAAVGIPTPWAMIERSQVYQPTVYPNGNWEPAGLNHEDAWFTASDGTRLHGWFLPCPDARAVLLFAHGNQGNVADLGDYLRDFCRRHRLAVMVFDYRGFGRSEGIPSEDGLFQDARAARAWLARRTRLNEGDIVLMGRSLGGGVMVELASKDGARGLVLESTFTSVPAVGRHHVPWLPVRLLMSNRFDSLTKIKNFHGPLLISHGDSDQVIPYSQGVALFEAAAEPKSFVTIPGGDHNDPQSEEFHAALDAFIASLSPAHRT